MYKLIKLIKKGSYFVPFTVYFLVFVAVIIPGYIYLKNLSKLPDSAYRDILDLLLTITLFFSIAVLCFGFFTVFICFLFFKWNQRKNKINFKLSTIVKKDSQQNNQTINISIKPILLPIIGYLKVRIVYDSTNVSEKITPTTDKNNFFKLMFNGAFKWNLPEIREYQIEKVIIYFEDFFQFFSIATTIDASNRFHINPSHKTLNNIQASPRKTEDTTIRIEELKRVEGELINYKNFETNDDVRRIVWKIYAKNKELVVRIPEIMDPYASHIYLYASFFTQFNVNGNEVIEVPFLNYYKTVCWSVYTQLLQKGLEVRYIADQPIPANAINDKDEAVKYGITLSKWQNETNLKDFIKPGSASVIIISSLNELEQVKQFAENYGTDISFVYVPLTESLEQSSITNMIKWIFIENEKNQASSYRTKWNISPLNLKIKQNEKELNTILKLTGKTTVIN